LFNKRKKIYFITKHIQGYPQSTLSAVVGSAGEQGRAAEEVASGSLPMAGPAPLALAHFHPEEVITLFYSGLEQRKFLFLLKEFYLWRRFSYASLIYVRFILLTFCCLTCDGADWCVNP
jgi:hypothetical protein